MDRHLQRHDDLSMLSSEMLRVQRSTWAMNVRCSSHSSAKSSCDIPRSARSTFMFGGENPSTRAVSFAVKNRRLVGNPVTP